MRSNNNTLLEFDWHEFQNAIQRKGLSLRETAKLTGIDRKTLYNAMLTGKVTYRTAKMLDAAHLVKFDMVNVIRCRDCIQWDKYDLAIQDADDKEWHHCPHHGIYTDEDFYCKDGERKEE